MTTIAFDGKFICCDGRVTVGSIIAEEHEKKAVKIDDDIFILAGDCFDAEMFLSSKAGDSSGAAQGAYIGFWVSELGVRVVYFDEGEKYWTCAHRWAIGSGGEFAIAAMDHGASAIDAVRYAHTKDNNTGKPYQLVDINKLSIKTLK